jgi:hypothetical protein
MFKEKVAVFSETHKKHNKYTVTDVYRIVLC